MIIGHRHIREAGLSDLDQIANLIFEAHHAVGDRSMRYDPSVVRTRLGQAWACQGNILVAEIDGAIVSTGTLVRTTFASATVALTLGATRPDMKGRGIGHELVLRRVAIAADLHAGIVLVSSRDMARWQRYGFGIVSRNPVSGAALMALQIDYGREV